MLSKEFLIALEKLHKGSQTPKSPQIGIFNFDICDKKQSLSDKSIPKLSRELGSKLKAKRPWCFETSVHSNFHLGWNESWNFELKQEFSREEVYYKKIGVQNSTQFSIVVSPSVTSLFSSKFSDFDERNEI